MKKLLLMLSFVLAGCSSANGPAFNEARLKNPNKATMVVYTNSWHSGASSSVPWYIDFNGANECALHQNGYIAKQIDPGKTTVSSSVFSSPGTSRIIINTKPANIYFVQIEVDGAKNVAGVMGGFIGQLAAEGVSSTGGPFLFTAVDSETASKKLIGLKQDCI